MKVSQYLDIREEAAKLALISMFGDDKETVSKINEAFWEADALSKRLLMATFGPQDAEAVLDIMALSVADVPIARA